MIKSAAGIWMRRPIITDARAQYYFSQLLALESISLGGTIEGQIIDWFAELIDGGFIHVSDTSGASDRITALYEFSLGSAAATKYNMLRPLDSDAAFRGTYAGGWTYNSTDATPNGTTGYFNTHIEPYLLSGAPKFTWGTYLRGDASAVGILGLFWISDGANFRVAVHYLYNKNIYSGQLGDTVSYATDNTKFFFSTRRSSTDVEFYRDGSSLGNGSNTVTNQAKGKFFFGARHITNLDGTTNTIDFYDDTPISIGIIAGDGFDDTESAAINTAMVNYATARGFNV